MWKTPRRYQRTRSALLISARRRRIDELDDVVRVARKTVTAHVTDADRRTRVLHEHWYLGLTSQQAEVPVTTAPG